MAPGKATDVLRGASRRGHGDLLSLAYRVKGLADHALPASATPASQPQLARAASREPGASFLQRTAQRPGHDMRTKQKRPSPSKLRTTTALQSMGVINVTTESFNPRDMKRDVREGLINRNKLFEEDELMGFERRRLRKLGFYLAEQAYDPQPHPDLQVRDHPLAEQSRSD